MSDTPKKTEQEQEISTGDAASLAMIGPTAKCFKST